MLRLFRGMRISIPLNKPFFGLMTPMIFQNYLRDTNGDLTHDPASEIFPEMKFFLAIEKRPTNNNSPIFATAKTKPGIASQTEIVEFKTIRFRREDTRIERTDVKLMMTLV
jgi:hypothetical protein